MSDSSVEKVQRRHHFQLGVQDNKMFFPNKGRIQGITDVHPTLRQGAKEVRSQVRLPCKRYCVVRTRCPFFRYHFTDYRSFQIPICCIFSEYKGNQFLFVYRLGPRPFMLGGYPLSHLLTPFIIVGSCTWDPFVQEIMCRCQYTSWYCKFLILNLSLIKPLMTNSYKQIPENSVVYQTSSKTSRPFPQ